MKVLPFLMLIAAAAAKPIVQNVTALPVTFYKGDLSSVDPYTIEYYKVYTCESASATYTQIKVSIILPANTQWNIDDAFVAAEVSTSETIFDSNTVFATNYIYSTSSPTLYDNIIWNMDNVTLNGSEFYIRFTGPIEACEYTFEISYTSGGNTVSGKYNFDEFGSTMAKLSDYNQVFQYIKNTESFSVANFDQTYFYFKFCDKNFPSTNFDLTVSVVSTPSSPYSAFNLYGCPKSFGITNCTIYNSDAISDKQAISDATIQMTNSNDFNIADGVYILVMGTGGSYNNENEFVLTATLVFFQNDTINK